MKLKLSLTLLFLTVAATLRADDDLIAQGKTAYVANCARCHGEDLKGDGPDAKRLWIVPRDLTSGKFKFKSTASGTPPSDDDLMNGIIGHGLGGSGMPSFGNMDSDTKLAIVAYVKSISPAFQGGAKPDPIPDPANRRSNPDLAKGKEIYDKFQCGLCHGPNGHANGMSAFVQKDFWERPIRVANLTQGWTYRAGQRPIDIYHRILAGIDGAPMPSFEGAAPHEDIWQLANYVASLQLDANWSGEIDAARVSGALPTKADDAAWKNAKRTDVNLQDYYYENGKRVRLTVNAVSVQAVYNDAGVAFKIFWEDPVEDKSPADALLTAIKPADYAGDTRGNLHNLYTPDAPALDMMLWQASNPIVVGQKKMNLAAASRPGWAANQSLQADASYNDGRWTLVFTRPFKMDGGETLAPGKEVRYIGFAGWDGHNGETGLKHTSSQWVRLVLGSQGHEH